jgi:hypothetical protein
MFDKSLILRVFFKTTISVFEIFTLAFINIGLTECNSYMETTHMEK